jgi:fucose permease
MSREVSAPDQRVLGFTYLFGGGNLTTKFMFRLLLITYLAFFSLGLPDTLLGAGWPAIKQDLAVPLSYAGVLSFMYNGFTIAAAFSCVAVTRAIGTGLTVAVSTLLTAVGLIGFALSGSFVFLLFFTIPLGFGAGCVDAALNSFVAIHFKARHMNWLHSFWGVGVSVSPLIMAASLKLGYGWHGALEDV